MFNSWSTCAIPMPTEEIICFPFQQFHFMHKKWELWASKLKMFNTTMVLPNKWHWKHKWNIIHFTRYAWLLLTYYPQNFMTSMTVYSWRNISLWTLRIFYISALWQINISFFTLYSLELLLLKLLGVTKNWQGIETIDASNGVKSGQWVQEFTVSQ